MYNPIKTVSIAVILLFIVQQTFAQTIHQKLSTAFAAFESDPQMKNGIASLLVADAEMGSTIFQKNSSIGLAPASTQKVITAATAYELLGKDFRYSTSFGVSATSGTTTLYIRPSGDPTFGSWRWTFTAERAVISRLMSLLSQTKITSIENIVVLDEKWNSEAIPGGWIWDDIGNYYGAGAEALNWRENQFDLILQSGKDVGDDVKVIDTKPKLYNYLITSSAKAAAKGTGDNAYIYFPVGRSTAVVRGTIPAGENNFTISGTMPSPRQQFISTLSDSLRARGYQVADAAARPAEKTTAVSIYTHSSPPLDTISYWFLKRSINLYGEALAKSIAIANNGDASTSRGVKAIKEFWKSKGVPDTELNIFDGSGLSPLNRVTTAAQVKVLQYAREQNWFNSYFAGFPEYNGMKMKSGTINGVKSFCGYHRSSNGKQYIFSFIVNNYNGSASGIVQKMYTVLNTLK